MRAGYAYAKSTVGPEGVHSLFLAIAEPNLTFGVGLCYLVPGLALDPAFLYTPRTTITGDATNQSAFEPDGTPNGYQLSAGLDGRALHVGVGHEF